MATQNGSFFVNQQSQHLILPKFIQSKSKRSGTKITWTLFTHEEINLKSDLSKIRIIRVGHEFYDVGQKFCSTFPMDKTLSGARGVPSISRLFTSIHPR